MNPMILEWALLVVIGVHILLAVSCRYDLKYDQLLKVRTVIFFPSPPVVDVCSSNCPRTCNVLETAAGSYHDLVVYQLKCGYPPCFAMQKYIILYSSSFCVELPI